MKPIVKSTYFHCFSSLLYNIPTGNSKKIRKDCNWMEHINSWSILMMLIYWMKT